MFDRGIRGSEILLVDKRRILVTLTVGREPGCLGTFHNTPKSPPTAFSRSDIRASSLGRCTGGTYIHAQACADSAPVTLEVINFQYYTRQVAVHLPYSSKSDGSPQRTSGSLESVFACKNLVSK